jgi:alkylation response protein AidB-like acyl-CoA dehydrogenase
MTSINMIDLIKPTTASNSSEHQIIDDSSSHEPSWTPNEANQTHPNPLAIAQSLAQEFSETVLERDAAGVTPKLERDRIRQSGLLKLVIPQSAGGWGQNWIVAMAISRELAQVDSSIAHVYSYHHLGVIIPHLFGTAAQRDYYYEATVHHNWFWCNALNPLDRNLKLTREGNHYRLNGFKTFCSGAKDSDILPTMATCDELGQQVIVILPTQRAGIEIQDNWDNIGQRQTDSGSVVFNNVFVEPEARLDDQSHIHQPFRTIRACLTQLNLANIYLGIAIGALSSAKHYTRHCTRPWPTSGVSAASDDPYILQRYGQWWVGLEAATALCDRAAERLQAAWDRGWDLSAEERAECAIAIAAAKVMAHQVGLDITSGIFETMGARSSSRCYGFDHFWRNLRTFTLHDPIDYKIKALGNWALNDHLPNPDFYL